MSEWRPESWENDFEYKRALEGEYLLPSVVFEAGADAMLAAIWKMARESCTGTFVFDTHYFGNHAVLYDSEAYKRMTNG